ncbi:type III secretion system protein PrgI [Enterococcus plantarum]|uniref:PrgI family mobile element protein n=1 Tax=Enterococcus plantarum TaxID=1077675 RepID=UPI00084DA85E|nr:PrgI family protein [Enterococcus plantarum]OEG18027.1 type III secretion system protein PrgI [Enterococcus plantarum]
MAIGSQFYKDVSKIERKVWGISIRQLKAYVLLAGTALILGVEIFFLPDWAFLIFSLPTAIVLGYYPVFLLLDTWKEKKRKFELYFYYEDRPYRSGQIRRYGKHEFTSKETVKETDEI